MITCKRCSEVEANLVFEAFNAGFSDYMIKFDMTMELFMKRFFGPEGNTLENSFVALDDEMPIGLILGGIKEYEGIRTMRCGTLCIHPEYRGKSVSRSLYELHMGEAIKNSCRQLFLEVIVGNDRAINFYKRLGYEKIYDIGYFTLKDSVALSKYENTCFEIRQIGMQELKGLRSKAGDVHINWQNDMEYIEKLEGQLHFGAYYENSLIGAASIGSSGKISFIWVDKLWRKKGAATAILSAAIKRLNLSKLSIAFPNNALLEGFLKQRGFKRDNVSQYEMYLTI